MGSGLPSGVPAPQTRSEAVSPAEPLVHWVRVPGRIEVQLPDLEALYDRTARPAYPHSSPTIEGSIARFLLTSAREQRRSPNLELVLKLGSSPLGSNEEAATRDRLSHYFSNEEELAALDRRANRSEGVGSLGYAAPLVALALLVVGLLYSQVGALSGTGYLVTLVYLVFITIVWVMLWDPLEVLLFDSYLIRSRARACHKLATATVRFSYPPRLPPDAQEELGTPVGADRHA